MACPWRLVLLAAASAQRATGLANRVEEERVIANFRTWLRHRPPRSSRVALRLVRRDRRRRRGCGYTGHQVGFGFEVTKAFQNLGQSRRVLAIAGLISGRQNNVGNGLWQLNLGD